MTRGIKFSHRYKLIKDLPTYPKGWEFGWSGDNELFYPYEVSDVTWKRDNNGGPGIYLDYKHMGYTVKQLANKEWFEPISKEVDYIPKLPDKEKIENYICLLSTMNCMNL